MVDELNAAESRKKCLEKEIADLEAKKSLLEVSNESARGQADAVISAARNQAQKTVAEAQEQANLIVAEAQKKAESILRERIGRMSAVCAQLNDMFDKDE